jgi:hypothetical protein
MLIDTGVLPRSATFRDFAPDWMLDRISEDAPDLEVGIRIAEHLIGNIKGYRAASWARKRLLAQWNFLAMLAEQSPETFDAVLMEYAEHLTTLRD